MKPVQHYFPFTNDHQRARAGDSVFNTQQNLLPTLSSAAPISTQAASATPKSCSPLAVAHYYTPPDAPGAVSPTHTGHLGSVCFFLSRLCFPLTPCGAAWRVYNQGGCLEPDTLVVQSEDWTRGLPYHRTMRVWTPDHAGFTVLPLSPNKAGGGKNRVPEESKTDSWTKRGWLAIICAKFRFCTWTPPPRPLPCN